jgi:hypothetical protein
MYETVVALIESGRRLRVSAAWLDDALEGYVNDRIWRADPETFFLETDDHEVYALDLTDPSLQIAIADTPCPTT